MKFSAWLNSIVPVVWAMILAMIGLAIAHAGLILRVMPEEVPHPWNLIASGALGAVTAMAVMLTSVHKEILPAWKGVVGFPLVFAFYTCGAALIFFGWEERESWLLSTLFGLAEFSFAFVFTRKFDKVKAGAEQDLRDVVKRRKKQEQDIAHREHRIAELQRDQSKLEQALSDRQQWIADHSCVCGYFSENPKKMSGHKTHCEQWKNRDKP